MKEKMEKMERNESSLSPSLLTLFPSLSLVFTYFLHPSHF